MENSFDKIMARFNAAIQNGEIHEIHNYERMKGFFRELDFPDHPSFCWLFLCSPRYFLRLCIRT